MRGKTSFAELSLRTGLPASRFRQAAKGQKLGDPKRLAKSLGVHVQTVRRWARNGVPAKRLESVVAILADIAAVTKAEKAERKKVKQLVSEARKKGVLKKALPAGERRFGGPRAVGTKTVFHLNQYLDDDTLVDIEELVSGAPKGPRYIITVVAVEAGSTGKVRGYGGVITQKLGIGAENMSFGSAITSGSYSTKREALMKLFSKLEDAIEDAESLVYLTDLQIFSYRYKDTLTSKRLRSLKERGK